MTNAEIESAPAAASPGRDKFGSKFQYLMTSISYSVGLGNVWRFPYLCYRNGGGTFLIPYFINIIFVGLVFFFFESIMGQYTSQGPMEVFKITPIFRGISYGSMFFVVFLCTYYNMLIAWAIFFFYESFQSVVPWSHCHTSECVELNQMGEFMHTNYTGVAKLKPSEDYFFNVVLKVTPDVEHFGSFRPHLLLCLAIAWIIVYLALCFGAKFLGKISTFTTVFPYVMLTALTIQGCMLDGAGDGIIHYLKPDWEALTESRVWADAGSQIFYALTICIGGVITLASYNQFHNNTFRDAAIVVSVNTFTSIFSGFAIFSVIGYLAKQTGVPVSKAVDGGVGLAFIAYPSALAVMPASNVWSAVFFFMIIVLGFGSQFTLVETASSNIADRLPKHWNTPKPVVLLGTCLFFFVLALPMCTGAGYYVLQLMDNYAANYSVFALGIVESIALAWCYGADKILDHFKVMAGFEIWPRLYWKIMISFITPLMITGVLVTSIYDFKPLSINVKGETYKFPLAVESIGFVMTLLSVSMVPIFAVIECLEVRKGNKTFRQIFCDTDVAFLRQQDDINNNDIDNNNSITPSDNHQQNGSVSVNSWSHESPKNVSSSVRQVNSKHHVNIDAKLFE